MVAKQKLGYAFLTSIVPIVILVSGICEVIIRGNALVFFKDHWLFTILTLGCIAGLACFAFVEIREGLAFRRMTKKRNL